MTDMMQQESPGGNLLVRRWRQTNLRTRLMLGTILVSIAAVGVLFFFVRNRSQETTALILEQFGTLSHEQAADALNTLAADEAHKFEDFFQTVTDDLHIASDYVTTLFAQQAVLGQGEYWNANEELVQLGEGQWGNSTDDPGSFLAPASFELNQETAVIVNTGIIADFLLPEILDANPEMLAVYYIDQTGATFYYPNVDLANVVGDFDPRERPYYQTFITDSTEYPPSYWSEPYADAALNGLVSTNSVPVFSPAGEFTGVVAADLLIKTITDRVSELSVGETGYSFLVDRNGQYIAVPEQAYADLGLTEADVPGDAFPTKTALDAPDALRPVIAEMMAAGQGLQTFTSNGVEKFIAYAPIDGVGYSLGIVVPVAEMQQAFLSARQQVAQGEEESEQGFVIVAVVVLLVSALFGFVISEFLTQPIVALTDAAEQLASGNLDVRVSTEAGGEIGVLAHTFNETTRRVHELVDRLEQRVSDRTRALEASTEVSRRLSTLLDQERLVEEVVDQVQQAFNYYHVHVYLLDEQTKELNMVGGTGEVGQTLLARGHHLSWGTGLVGRCAANNDVVLVANVAEASDWLPNPLLPDTKTEIAVPIAIGDRVLGVLDVQGDKAGELDEEDIRLLQSVANQVAVALRNARMFEQTQRQAEQEAIINQINQRIQNAPDVNAVLQVAAKELGQALKAQRTAVQLSVRHNEKSGNGRSR